MRLADENGVPIPMTALDEEGKVVARGFLEVPFIPEGYGGQIATGLQFVTSEPTGGAINADDAAAILNSGNPHQ